MAKRSGKLIRISDEAYEKLKKSTQTMSNQVDLALGIEHSQERPSKKPLESDTKGFKRMNTISRKALKNSVKNAIVKTSKKGIGTTRKQVIAFLNKDTGYIEMVAQYGYINSAPHTKKFNTLIDNELKRLVRDEVVRMNRQFYIMNPLNELGEPKKRFWKR